MKIDTQIREDHQAKITVELEPERLEEMKRRAAAKIARKVKLPGFRPGKAPYAVVLRQVGEASILEEAIEMLVDEIYPDVVKESGIKAYGPGQLEGVPSMEPPTFEFVVPLEAETTLGDYRSIQKPYEPKPVTDEDVDAVLKDLQERQAIVEPVERPAQVGDLVSILLSAKRSNPEEGQDETLIRERSYPVVVESSEQTGEESWPFEGFSANLIGLSAGDEKTVEYTYPEDSPYETLRGVEAEFHFTVENVKARTLPELNDEFVKEVGEFDNLAALKENIQTSLQAQREEEYNQEYDEEIIKQAVETTSYKYPPQMLERELDEVVDNIAHRLEHQNLTLDLYLKSRDMDMDAFRKEMEPTADSRLKRSLFLMEFGRAENIQIKPEELQAEATQTMNYLMQSLPEKEARQLSDRQVQSNIIGNVLADMLSNRAILRFRNIARGIEEEPDDEAPADSEIEANPAEDVAGSLVDQEPSSQPSVEASSAGKTGSEGVQQEVE